MSKILNEEITIGKDIQLAFTRRESSSEDAPNLVFIHGFGSSREHFRFAFENNSLIGYNLISLDLIGFGDSSKPDKFSYEMSNQAAFTIQALNELGMSRFHICAHSMGGLVAMEMISQSPPQALSFINLEGNLTLDDCFVTGGILKVPLDDFLDSGRSKFEKGLREYPAYLKNFQKASSLALYKSADDTVRLSSNPQLIEEFIHLPLKKCYIYGEKNKGTYPAEKTLLDNKISVYYVRDSDHTMARQNPTHLYSIVNKFITSS